GQGIAVERRHHPVADPGPAGRRLLGCRRGLRRGLLHGFILPVEGAPAGGRGALASSHRRYTGSGCRSGRVGSGAGESRPGHHRRRCSSTLAVVTRYVRTRKVSRSTPTAMTKPSSTRATSGRVVRTANVAAST